MFCIQQTGNNSERIACSIRMRSAITFRNNRNPARLEIFAKLFETEKCKFRAHYVVENRPKHCPMHVFVRLHFIEQLSVTWIHIGCCGNDFISHFSASIEASVNCVYMIINNLFAPAKSIRFDFEWIARRRQQQTFQFVWPIQSVNTNSSLNT